MSAVAQSCFCGSIGAERKIRFCDDHHRYWFGDKELASVSRVLRMWPQPDCNSCGWPLYSKHMLGCLVKQKIDHARERGTRVDRHAQTFLRTGRVAIRRGEEWQEVIDLLAKLIPWLQGAGKLAAQTILYNDDIAGTCDFLIKGMIADLKCTYDVQFEHTLQLGAYAELCEASHGWMPESLGIVHVTERFREPQWIPVNPSEALSNWRTVKAMWYLYRKAA